MYYSYYCTCPAYYFAWMVLYCKGTIRGLLNGLYDSQVLKCRVKKYIDYFNIKGYKITMRNHPSDKRNWNFTNTFVSKNDLYTDLSHNNIILCNETALILEGMICNKLIYKCSFSDFFDNYGYVKDKLVLKEYSNPQNLHLDIINKSISYDKSKLDYYTGDLSNHKIHIDELNNFINNF